MTKFEIISTIIALVSLLGAIFSIVLSILSSNKVNKFNMRNNYFDIFKEDLTYTFPNLCSSFISSESEIINDDYSKQLEEFITTFRNKIKFLFYIDEIKYKELDKTLVNLEEEVIVLPTRTDNKCEHIKNFNMLVKKVYKLISAHFS